MIVHSRPANMPAHASGGNSLADVAAELNPPHHGNGHYREQAQGQTRIIPHDANSFDAPDGVFHDGAMGGKKLVFFFLLLTQLSLFWLLVGGCHLDIRCPEVVQVFQVHLPSIIPTPSLVKTQFIGTSNNKKMKEVAWHCSLT